MRCPSPLWASVLRRLVGEIENARAEGLRVDELQRLLIAPVLKQTLSAPHPDSETDNILTITTVTTVTTKSSAPSSVHTTGIGEDSGACVLALDREPTCQKW